MSDPMASFDSGIAVGLGGIGLMLPFAAIALAAWGIQKLREAIASGYWTRIDKLQAGWRKAEQDHERSAAELAAIERVLDDYGVAKLEVRLSKELEPMSTARRVRVAMEARKS